MAPGIICVPSKVGRPPKIRNIAKSSQKEISSVVGHNLLLIKFFFWNYLKKLKNRLGNN